MTNYGPPTPAPAKPTPAPAKPTSPPVRPPPPPPQPEGASDSKAEGQEPAHGHHDSSDPLAWLRDSVPGNLIFSLLILFNFAL